MAKLPAICIQGFLWKFGTQALAEKHEISLGPGASVDCIALMSPGPEGLYGLTMAAMASWDMTPKKLWRYGYGKSLHYCLELCSSLLPWRFTLASFCTASFWRSAGVIVSAGMVCSRDLQLPSPSQNLTGTKAEDLHEKSLNCLALEPSKYSLPPPANWCGWCD